MPVCTETESLSGLEFLNLSAEPELANMFRRMPIAQVKKSYSRFAVLPRYGTLEHCVAVPLHEFGENHCNISGFIDFYGAELAAVESVLNRAADADGWLYLLMVTDTERLNWYTAIKVAGLIETSDRVRLAITPLYRKLMNGYWAVSQTPFEVPSGAEV